MVHFHRRKQPTLDSPTAADRDRGAHEAPPNCHPALSGKAGRRVVSNGWLAAARARIQFKIATPDAAVAHDVPLLPVVCLDVTEMGPFWLSLDPA